MTARLLPRSWALMVAGLMSGAALLGYVSRVRAGDITYNIVDYPANEAIEPSIGPSSGTDTISGTIITDGTLGPLSEANIVGGTLSFTSPFGTLTGPASFGDPVGLDATSTELLLDPNVDSSLSISTAVVTPLTIDTAQVQYANYPGNGQYSGVVGYTSVGIPDVLSSAFNSSPVGANQGSIGANSSWVIATVPEPTSLSLLSSAVLAILVSCRRRR